MNSSTNLEFDMLHFLAVAFVCIFAFCIFAKFFPMFTTVVTSGVIAGAIAGCIPALLSPVLWINILFGNFSVSDIMFLVGMDYSPILAIVVAAAVIIPYFYSPTQKHESDDDKVVSCDIELP